MKTKVGIKKLGFLGVRQSISREDVKHTIYVNRYGRIACSCEGWIFHYRKSGGDCGHIQSWKAANTQGRGMRKIKLARSRLVKAGVYITGGRKQK